MTIKQRKVSGFRPVPWETKSYFLIPILKHTHCILIYMEDYDMYANPGWTLPFFKSYVILPKHSVNLNNIFFNERDGRFYEGSTPLISPTSLATDVLLDKQVEFRNILNNFYISEGVNPRNSWSKAFSIVVDENTSFPYFLLRDIPLI